MIPPGWKEAHIGDVVTDLKSGLSRKLSLSDIGLPVIRSTNITDQGLLDLSDIKYWHRNDPQGACTENYFLQAGDILVNFINSVAQIGKCALYQGELDRDTIYTTNIFCVRVNDRILSEYFLLSSRTREYAHYIHSITKPAVNQASFTTKDFKRFRFALPPLSEQRKITEILGTWDEAIALTERRIEAARQRKKGLMQRLLTGRVRFSEFVGEGWREVAVGDLGETYSGLRGKSRDDFGQGKPYIPYLNIYNNWTIDPEQMDYVSIEDGERQNRVKYGDILFTTSSETPDEVGMSSVLLNHLGETYLNSFCCGFRLNDFSQLLPEYAVYLLRGEDFRHAMHYLAQGATRYNLPKRYLLEASLRLPPLAEQYKIAKVLSTCDREIELLAQERAALQRQKKDLMQRLLTGRVRVEV